MTTFHSQVMPCVEPSTVEDTSELENAPHALRGVVQCNPLLLWTSGPDACRTFFNEAWLDFTGRTLEDEWGVGWTEGVHFEDYQTCLDTYVTAFREREPFETEYRLRRADGEYRWVLDKGAPRYGAGGAFAGYVGSCVDVTTYKMRELELKRTIHHRDDFLSIASHELKTPLTSLQLQLGSLMRALKDSSLQGPYSRVLKTAQASIGQVARLSALVDELFDVSQASAGRLELSLAEVDLVEVVRDATARLDLAARSSDTSIDVEAPAPLCGTWDRGRLDRIVTNLVANAVKFGAGKRVSVRVRAASGVALLEVRDEGLGIDPRDQERIFERFERASAARHYRGSGLGLWIVRELVHAHGGRIAVESEEGHGSTFTVSLPLEPSCTRPLGVTNLPTSRDTPVESGARPRGRVA